MFVANVCVRLVRCQIELNSAEREQYKAYRFIYIRFFQQLVQTNKLGMRLIVRIHLAQAY